MCEACAAQCEPQHLAPTTAFFRELDSTSRYCSDEFTGQELDVMEWIEAYGKGRLLLPCWRGLFGEKVVEQGNRKAGWIR